MAVRVVAIPDSFKGSASAIEVAEAMADGAREAYADRGVAVSVHTLPFADGGEGTLDALLGAWGTKALTVDTTDALGRPTRARYGISADGRTGVVEAADGRRVVFSILVDYPNVGGLNTSVWKPMQDEICEALARGGP